MNGFNSDAQARVVVLATVTGDDGAIVEAVHNPAERCFDVFCSHHMIGSGGFYRRRYDQGTTDAERDWMRGDAILCATMHAAEKHNAPRTATEGDQP